MKTKNWTGGNSCQWKVGGGQWLPVEGRWCNSQCNGGQWWKAMLAGGGQWLPVEGQWWAMQWVVMVGNGGQ